MLGSGAEDVPGPAEAMPFGIAERYDRLFLLLLFLLLLTSPPSESTIRSNQLSKEGAPVSEVRDVPATTPSLLRFR